MASHVLHVDTTRVWESNIWFLNLNRQLSTRVNSETGEYWACNASFGQGSCMVLIAGVTTLQCKLHVLSNIKMGPYNRHTTMGLLLPLSW
jgi:hypothetical protein